MRNRTRAAGAFIAGLLLCLAPAAAQDAAPGPSTASKALRALGFETAPGARGDKAYRKGDYEEALRQYGKAAEETGPASPHRRRLDLNIGNALYRQKRYTEAADSYEQALKGAGDDSAFAAQGHHNLGNAFFRKAEEAARRDTTDPAPAIADLREAAAHYKKALRLDPKAPRPKQNLEMTNGLLQRLLARQEQQKQQQQGQPPKPPEPSARAKEALARALQLTQERRYPEAVAVLNDIMRTDRTAASFSAHLKRLDDVMKILRGERPEDPTAQDPRALPGAGRRP